MKHKKDTMMPPGPINDLVKSLGSLVLKGEEGRKLFSEIMDTNTVN